MNCSALGRNQPKFIMRGLDPRIHAVARFVIARCKGWMTGSGPAMTSLGPLCELNGGMARPAVLF